MDGLQWGEVVKDWPEPSVEELAYDELCRRNARAHCPGCGGFCRPEKVRWIHRGDMGSRRVADGVCSRCGEYEIPLD